jgi:hypothetical protein
MDHLPELEFVFDALTQPLPRGAMVDLANLTHVPYTTLCTWRSNLLVDPNWRPSHASHATCRVFTEEEEAQLVSDIVNRFLDKHLYYSDDDFAIDAVAFYNRISQEKCEAQINNLSMMGLPVELPIREFHCSPRFIEAFRKRHALALRRPHFKRRPAVSEEQIENFLDTLENVIEHTPPERLINIDETHWKLVAGGFLTWAKKGRGSIQCMIQNNDKEGVTAIAGIDYAGNKLPLMVIGKGKTPKCLKNLAIPDRIWSDFSPSGWTTIAIMCRYFDRLRTIYPDGNLVVMLDTYSAHRSEIVKEYARGLNIRLLFIPPGCTDRMQPLDRRIFGILKAHARRMWRKHYHETNGEKELRDMMVVRLLEAWDDIPEDAIHSAWDVDKSHSWGREGTTIQLEGEDDAYLFTISTGDSIDQ